MGAENISISSSQNENTDAQVVLNVYDLTSVNNYTYWFGFGIFHSGIEVHGKEYGFGAHDFPVSGVFEVEPRSCPGFIYRCSIPLGRINMPSSEFHDISHRLVGKYIPRWVNRLARLGSLCSCLLPESLQVTTIKQLPEYHECMEDGNESLATTTPRESTEIDDADQEKHLLSPNAECGEVAFVKEVHK
ncbi:deSI-like protein At4g17486 isoform X2 [Hevea brasiliensis]|uniref:deSI-like protein At4g17486 isoform X2 n=1 Tax=Hevea brasiliensis TaxID=3981 RepID=UPI0025D6CCBA|nr:deSI-like protein At4g17486 isoform X2 [Hevea brasiliensis]